MKILSFANLFSLIHSPEEKIKSLERRVMGLIEESCMAASRGEIRLALDRAKEASSKERSLIRQREQAGLSDGHNLDLTFSVRTVNHLLY